MTVSAIQGRGAHGVLAAVGLSLMASVSFAGDFDPASRDDVAALIDQLDERGVPRDWAEAAMRQADFSQEVLDAMEGAAERRLRWDEYREIFLQRDRILQGAAFIDAHRDAFERAEVAYGVPPEMIAAIIGVETKYGQFTGRHRVLDSLSTLGFHHPSRHRFFHGELAAFLEIAHDEGVEPGSLYGSYAGAMGYPQFIPTSYRAYAVDFDGDDIRDLWTNPVDAIGSVGNYFAEHGWRGDEAILSEASGPDSLPDGIEFNATRPPYAGLDELADVGIVPEHDANVPDQVIPLAFDYLRAEDSDEVGYYYRLGHHNFYVITRYNHSHLYAMAVTELAERIAEAYEEGAWSRDDS
ncbi:membrane-bound lytic murein transglycosylase B [Franzmannia pantelleriensis]|uniref:Membrane-bound lytic murein transglycosylase B n=1 Tax=Franzmannia pantelleriensis TaxID=48727 RepID=A0A1G9VI35_9GAMM|nr:lytic murein transglycosylase B [Halomonas pantelleriensis]SDM71747.1 membrane-bound lytic murein transglycosylase B [Halomonas pantelleriensis]